MKIEEKTHSNKPTCISRLITVLFYKMETLLDFFMEKNAGERERELVSSNGRKEEIQSILTCMHATITIIMTIVMWHGMEDTLIYPSQTDYMYS